MFSVESYCGDDCYIHFFSRPLSPPTPLSQVLYTKGCQSACLLHVAKFLQSVLLIFLQKIVIPSKIRSVWITYLIWNEPRSYLVVHFVEIACSKCIWTTIVLNTSLNCMIVSQWIHNMNINIDCLLYILTYVIIACFHSVASLMYWCYLVISHSFCNAFVFWMLIEAYRCTCRTNDLMVTRMNAWWVTNKHQKEIHRLFCIWVWVLVHDFFRKLL